MAMQDCSESAAARDLAQDTAMELFHIAALMLGNEEDAVALVEETVARVEIDPCADSLAAQQEARTRLVQGALRRIAHSSPSALAAPDESAAVEITSCIETDDLTAAGVSNVQLAGLLAGSGRTRIRAWLEQLAPAHRVIFVLRAVVGQGGEGTAEDLRLSQAAGVQRWTAQQVSGAYRQALCSLATSLAMAEASTVSLPA